MGFQEKHVHRGTSCVGFDLNALLSWLVDHPDGGTTPAEQHASAGARWALAMTKRKSVLIVLIHRRGGGGEARAGDGHERYRHGGWGGQLTFFYCENDPTLFARIMSLKRGWEQFSGRELRGCGARTQEAHGTDRPWFWMHDLGVVKRVAPSDGDGDRRGLWCTRRWCLPSRNSRHLLIRAGSCFFYLRQLFRLCCCGVT